MLLNNSLTASDSLKFQFATDGEGNYGYLGADDSFIPFKESGFPKVIAYGVVNQYETITFTLEDNYHGLLLVSNDTRSNSVDIKLNGVNVCVSESESYRGSNIIGYLKIMNEIKENDVLTMHCIGGGSTTCLLITSE